MVLHNRELILKAPILVRDLHFKIIDFSIFTLAKGLLPFNTSLEKLKQC